MSVLSQAQMSVADEVTYGTAPVTSRFFEFIKESIKLDVQRIESMGLRKATRVQRSDRFAVNRKGAAGDVELEVQSKGYGFWNRHLLGVNTTTGPNGDGKFTHTATVGDMFGDSFALQVNRPTHPGQVDAPFTYHGGKISGFKIENEVDGILKLILSCDFEDEDTATGLAVASYPTAPELLTFVGGQIAIAGSSYDVNKFSLEVKNGLKTDRHYLRNNSLKKEPAEMEFREITCEVVGDFENLTQYNRFVSATASGAVASLTGRWASPTLIAGTSFPDYVVTMPAFRFDGETPSVESAEPLSITLKGKALFNGTDSPLSIAYGSVDATA